MAALALRDPQSRPLQVMACENAINATDILRDAIVELAGDDWPELSGRAVFANTAVDRIVPGQPEGGGVDVTVEPFYEWAIERPPFGDDPPSIPGAHFVDDLEPYIERKLFTVNTGHATTAYFGALAGVEKISDALAEPTIAAQVEAVLEETSALLVAKHELDPVSPGRVPGDHPAPLREPASARHRLAGGTPAAAQAVAARALRRSRRRGRRARTGHRRAGRSDGCRARVR